MFLFVEKKQLTAQQMTDTSDELVNIRVHLAGNETDDNTEQILRNPSFQAVESTQKLRNLEKKNFYFCK